MRARATGISNGNRFAVIIDDVQAIETSVLRGWQHLVRSVLEVTYCFQGKINGVISLFGQALSLSESEKNALSAWRH